MAPNAKSRLAKALAEETGLSLVQVYVLLKAGQLPKNRVVAKAWKAVVAREASPKRVAKRKGAVAACADSAPSGAA
jgi:MoxR-like ATPase